MNPFGLLVLMWCGIFDFRILFALFFLFQLKMLIESATEKELYNFLFPGVSKLALKNHDVKSKINFYLSLPGAVYNFCSYVSILW